MNNNNNSADNSAGAEICDVPYEVANQKRHVSIKLIFNSVIILTNQKKIKMVEYNF